MKKLRGKCKFFKKKSNFNNKFFFLEMVKKKKKKKYVETSVNTNRSYFNESFLVCFFYLKKVSQIKKNFF